MHETWLTTNLRLLLHSRIWHTHSYSHNQSQRAKLPFIFNIVAIVATSISQARRLHSQRVGFLQPIYDSFCLCCVAEFIFRQIIHKGSLIASNTVDCPRYFMDLSEFCQIFNGPVILLHTHQISFGGLSVCVCIAMLAAFCRELWLYYVLYK